MRVGLVLSGGGARGFAHIGVLKVLKKNNIQIDAIAGCSSGALIGACYAHNQDPQDIENLLLKMKSKGDIYDYSFSTRGLIKGNKIEQYISDYFGQDKKKTIKFEDLKIPLSINATDIVNRKQIIFDKGPLVPALMASMSYPGFFTTRKINDIICVDGGVMNPLPVNLLKVDYLILVDVSAQNIPIKEDSNFKDIVLQSTLIMQKVIVDMDLANCKTPYILINPDVEYEGIFDFDHIVDIIKKGEMAAEKVVKHIMDDITSKKDVKIVKA